MNLSYLVKPERDELREIPDKSKGISRSDIARVHQETAGENVRRSSGHEDDIKAFGAAFNLGIALIMMQTARGMNIEQLRTSPYIYAGFIMLALGNALQVGLISRERRNAERSRITGVPKTKRHLYLIKKDK